MTFGETENSAARPSTIPPALTVANCPPSRVETARDPLILILRTPKSASTSLSVIVGQAFPAARRFTLPNTLDLEGRISTLQRLRHARHAAQITCRAHKVLRRARVFDLINNEAAPGDLVTGGHVDFATCREHILNPVQMVALVRNPIDRSLSEYTYARAGFSRKGPLAKLDAGLIAKVAGRRSFEGYLDFLTEHRDIFGDIACRYLGLPPDGDIADHFARHVFHFGTVDNLAGFARGLARKTHTTVKLQHLNRTHGEVSRILTRAEQRKIETLYARDFALYEWCRKHEVAFQARTAAALLPDERHAALA